MTRSIRPDIEIEREAVDLLTQAAHDTCPLDPGQIRKLLTAVKVNNELERVADAASAIASRVIALGVRDSLFPEDDRGHDELDRRGIA